MRWLFFTLVAIGLLFWWLQPPPPVTGILAPGQPRQQLIANPQPFVRDDYTLTPMASFSLEAVVLRQRTYRTDRESQLAPVDVVLGWGPMSDSNVTAAIRIRQSGRFYFWSANPAPINPRLIATHSANMHLIPANASIDDKIRALEEGQLIQLKGKLVNVQAKDNWRWQSSLSRHDTGNGACELIWVEALEVRPAVPR